MPAFPLTVLTTLLAITANAQPTKRAAALTGKPLNITDLAITVVGSGNTTLNFTVHDPDPLTNATASCGGTWKSNSTDYPHDSYMTCFNDTSFAWNMQSYTSFQDFVLGIEHRFKDPSVGSPPYDEATTFSRAPVNTSVIACDVFGATTTCRQKAGVPISARIYAVTA